MNTKTLIQEIINHDGFFEGLAQRLCEMYDCQSFNSEELSFILGTNGWCSVLEHTFEEFGLIECKEYYRELPWDRSDDLDYLIAELLDALVFAPQKAESRKNERKESESVKKIAKNAIKILAIAGAAGLLLKAYSDYREQEELERFVLANLD